MKREVREEELLAVLVNRRPHENGALLYGVVKAGQTARFSSAIRDYLKGDSGFGQGMFPYRTAFDTVDRTREANFTDAALEVLRRANRPANGGFSYAAKHGETQADYLALKEMIGESRLSPSQALEDMRKRLGLDEEGNPIKSK